MEHSLKAANVHDGTEYESIKKNTNINNCVKNECFGFKHCSFLINNVIFGVSSNC